MRLGPFLLIDPPEGQAEMLRDTIAAIDYPWARLLPELRRDPQGAVVVRWDSNMQQGATGLYYPHKHDIVLGTRYANWQDKVPFVFTHEVGHLVDYATLEYDERMALLALMHEKDESRWAGEEDPNNPGEPHPWSHEREHVEEWNSVQKDYLFRPRESYADLFVCAFAPKVWTRSPRFVHWTEEFDKVRDITLRRNIVTYNDTEGTTHEDAIDWASVNGVIEGFEDGSFKPNEPVTRGQMATVLKRFYDNLVK